MWRLQVFVWGWITCVKFLQGKSKSVYLLCIALSKPISRFLGTEVNNEMTKCKCDGDAQHLH